MHKRLHVIIKPAVKSAETDHKTSWHRTEIRLPVSELKRIKTCLKSILVKTFFRYFYKALSYYTEEFFPVFLIGILGHNTVIRLIDTVLILGEDIIAYTCIEECFTEYRTLGIHKGIIYQLEGYIKLGIKVVFNDTVI